MSRHNKHIANVNFAKSLEVNRLEWLNALFDAIQTDVKHNNSDNTEMLASLGAYLSNDFAEQSTQDIKELAADE